MKKYLSLLLIILVMTACQQQVAKPAVSETIKIGFIGPLTGDTASLGTTLRDGAEIAVEEINAKGGVNGKKIEAIYEDGGCKAQGATLAAQKLINNDKVVLIIGGSCSSETLAAAPIAEEAKIILISPSSSNPDITKAGDYIFRTWPSDTGQGKAIAEKMIKDGITKVGIINTNSDYNIGLAKAFTESFTTNGGQVLIHEMYEQDSKDFRTQLTKIKAKNVEALYIVPYLEGGLILKQAKELGLTIPMYGSEVLGSKEIVNDAGGAAENVVYATAKFDDQAEPAKAFLAKYQQKYGKEPSYPSFAATAYDTVMVVTDAMKAGTESETIKNYLYNLNDYSGVAGTLTIDENGDALKEFQIMVIQNGEFIPLEKKKEGTTLPSALTITQDETGVLLSADAIEKGKVELTIKNAAQDQIATALEGPEIDEIYNTAPGKTTQVEISLAPGNYVVYDPVGDHRSKGLEATFTVVCKTC
ncbi:penicillin-binding protein activator [Candidatus Woesearchaeota archaeon]|nr:penicillin-binding protein activator [Candidatus Woesearchaeota archaeon]